MKKNVTYDKIEIAGRLCKAHIEAKCNIFFLLTGATLYYHVIYIVFTKFGSFTGCKDDFLKLFLICTFKDKTLAEDRINLTESLNKIAPRGVCFFNYVTTKHKNKPTYTNQHKNVFFWPVRQKKPSLDGRCSCRKTRADTAQTHRPTRSV